MKEIWISSQIGNQWVKSKYELYDCCDKDRYVHHSVVAEKDKRIAELEKIVEGIFDLIKEDNVKLQLEADYQALKGNDDE